MNAPIKFVDAFSGIGGFHAGIKATGIPCRCVAAIEKDTESRLTYKRNWQSDRLYADIRLVDPKQLPDHELLFGGFPCQPFSAQGKGMISGGKVDSSDPRTNLFLFLIEILRHKQPERFLFENVPGILRIKNCQGQPMVEVVREAIEGVGYVVDIVTRNAKNFGVPQNRERVWFVGQRSDVAKPLTLPHGSQCNVRVRDILEAKASVRDTVQYAWRRKRTKRGRNRLAAIRERQRVIEPDEALGRIALTADLPGEIPSGLCRHTDKVFSVDGIAPCLTTMFHPAFDADPWRLLSPREFARLQGFPDSFRLHPNPTMARRQFGNAVCVPVVAALVKELLEPSADRGANWCADQYRPPIYKAFPKSWAED